MGRKRTDPITRLFDGAHETAGGCWLSTLSPKASGYVRIWDGERSVAIHRFAYELWVGPIPDGMTIDHLCHDPASCSPGPCQHRACMNPEHLAVVPMRENVLRGGGPSARNANASACVHGHPLDGSNLFITPKGWRMCRECARRRGRESERKRYAAGKKRRAA